MSKIDELKRQMTAANDKAKEAAAEASDAKARYYDAVLDATGFKGCIAEYSRTRGYGMSAKTEIVRFVVQRVGRWSNSTIEGRRIKVDGSLSAFDGSCSISDAKNLGPYEAPDATRSKDRSEP